MKIIGGQAAMRRDVTTCEFFEKLRRNVLRRAFSFVKAGKNACFI